MRVLTNFAERLDTASADEIINIRYCWNLRDDNDGLYSTENMNDEQLQQAAAEDLLNVISWRMEGKEVGGDISHLTRFLNEPSKELAIEAFNPMVQSLTIVQDDGTIELDPAHLQDAMNFAGVWGWDIFTDEPVYKLGR